MKTNNVQSAIIVMTCIISSALSTSLLSMDTTSQEKHATKYAINEKKDSMNLRYVYAIRQDQKIGHISFYNNGKRGYIKSITVDTPFGGRGIGSELFLQALEYLQQTKKCVKIRWQTENATPFFSRFGARIEDAKKRTDDQTPMIFEFATDGNPRNNLKKYLKNK